jgi:hypothetical protein
MPIRKLETEIISTVKLTCADGSVLERSYGVADEPPSFVGLRPHWITNPDRSWVHPQSPILLTGNVKPGFEDEARSALGIDTD